MATFKAVILKGEGHVKADGTTNLKIRITHNKKSEYISTDIFVVPDKTKRGYSLGSNADYITDRATDYISKYQKAYLRLGDSARLLTAKELKQAIVEDENTEIDFIKFAEDYMKELEDNGQEGSLRAVRGFMSKLKRYTHTLTFSQIDSKFLSNFEKFMVKDGVGNAIATYMSRFRVIFNKGRDQYNDEDRGILKITNYPFKKYYKDSKIKQHHADANENSLTIEQIKMFMNSKPIDDTKRITLRAEVAKEVWMLMIYLIGPNSKDLFFADNPVKGRWKYDRYKTGRAYGIKLEPEAIEIIDRYKGKKGMLNFQERFEDYQYFQKYINNGLRDICISMHEEFMKTRTDEQKRKKVVLDFPQKITTNWARHTWATIARNDCGIDKDNIALCLGHKDKDNIVTDMYIKYDYSIIDKCNRKVIDLINSKNT